MLIYLDNCCFNRPFDDQGQLRIRLETEAKLHVQEMVLNNEMQLAWSYILDFENSANPFEHRKASVAQWKSHAFVDTGETKQIIKEAARIHNIGVGPKDALHVACAIEMGCDYFLTTDDALIKKISDLKGIKVVDPIFFIREVLK